MANCMGFLHHAFFRLNDARSLDDDYFDFVAATDELEARSIPMIGKTVLYHCPARSPTSRECVRLVKSWIEHCVEHHEACKRANMRLPKWLIDVCPSSTDSSSVSLQRTADIPNYKENLRYAALSYCWGSPACNSLLTTTETLLARQRGIAVCEMPATLSDAVTVARNCGLKYLWIDALCICQDDMDEWEHEAARMGDIYAGSMFVISALSTFDSAQGFLRIRNPVSTPLGHLNMDAEADKQYYLFLRRWPKQLYRRLENDPLSMRAWTYQERTLAPAILHFAEDELIWECRTLRTSECRVQGNILPKEKGKDQELRWQNIVEEYAGRHITKVQDRLPAIAGVASWMRQSSRCSGPYAAGLWERDLFRQLLFSYSSLAHVDSSKKQLDIPSWSWAHWDGRKIDTYGSLGHTDPLDEWTSALLECPVFCFPDGMDRQRSQTADITVSSCSIRLEGYMQSLREWDYGWRKSASNHRLRLDTEGGIIWRWNKRGAWLPSLVHVPSFDEFFTTSSDKHLCFILDDIEDAKVSREQWGRHYALRMAVARSDFGYTSIYYLVLEEVESCSDHTERVFKRAGIICLRKKNSFRYANDPKEDIVDPEGNVFLTDAQVMDIALI